MHYFNGMSSAPCCSASVLLCFLDSLYCWRLINAGGPAAIIKATPDACISAFEPMLSSK